MTDICKVTRRHTLALGAGALVSTLARPAWAEEGPERPGIIFHDGSPLTAHDVAFSLKILKEKGHPIAQQLLRDFVGAEATDDATVVLTFAPKRARDVPLFTASLPIFSREYYSKHAFDETTLEP